MSETHRCDFCGARLITGDEAGCYCTIICEQCGRVQPKPRPSTARRRRDRAQVERHVARLVAKSFGEQEATARILRYLRTTKKEWR